FARMGYGGTRIEDIAAEAGTSRTAVYHYFPSKREIFIEIGREATIAFHDVLDTIRAMPEAWNSDHVGELVDRHLAYLDEHGAVIYTWSQATWDDPELRDVGLDAQFRSFAAFGAELARVRGRSDVDPAQEAIAFLGMAERLWYFSRSGGAGAVTDDELRRTLVVEAEAILRR